MQELQLNLTADERNYLAGLLETVLKDTRVEEHRTRALNYRERILQDEKVIVGLLKKLGHTAE